MNSYLVLVSSALSSFHPFRYVGRNILSEVIFKGSRTRTYMPSRCLSRSVTDTKEEDKTVKTYGILDRESTIAKEGFNRWMNVPASFMVQLSIGSVYAWSIFNVPLTKELGVVCAASTDWSLGSVVMFFFNRLCSYIYCIHV